MAVFVQILVTRPAQTLRMTAQPREPAPDDELPAPRRLLSDAQIDGLARILGPIMETVAAERAAAEAAAQADRADSGARPK